MSHVLSIAEEILANDLILCQADEIYQDLMYLERNGVWKGPGCPKWVKELKSHFNVPGAADTVIILVAWRAIAKKYYAEVIR
ncbi:hypothetical protein LCGC14_0142710 [marine sediment metagenome]|uniref:Uncharacterized protein n=1 Tax=marine sediment metagenome TaxID=412755 RepID=A0A0F9XIJ1_9ZZZZ